MSDIVQIKIDIDKTVKEYKSQVEPHKLAIKQIKNFYGSKLKSLELKFEIAKEELIGKFSDGLKSHNEDVQIKVVKHFEVADKTLIPEQYFKTVLDYDKIKRHLKRSDFTENIPGIKIKAKRILSVKTK